jgi:uncharacterized repeat protein (TIGR02059 family)
MRTRLVIFILLTGNLMNAQSVLNISGQTYSNSNTDWGGVNIPRSVKTNLTFRNNSITSSNSTGYMLQAGDENVIYTNNNLDGAVVTGNQFKWIGTDLQSITHGLFTGYNINQTIKYNYLEGLPYGVVFKSGTNDGVNMTNSTGVVAYNIIKNSKIGVRIKGINNIRIYNNTFYSSNSAGSVIYITNNDGATIPAPSTGTKIYNNIFYTVAQKTIIDIESSSLSGLECDYNVYFSEAGDPVFIIGGASYSWSQWRSLGYDSHSVIINPGFQNTVNFVPSRRLDYGTDLGSSMAAGLSSASSWGTTDPATVNQNGAWQVGAVLYAAIVQATPAYVGSQVNSTTPSILEMSFDLDLANIVPPVSAFAVSVNSSARSVSSAAISGTRVLLTLASPVAYGDVITLSYTRPPSSPIQSVQGVAAGSFSASPVQNHVPPPNPAYLSSVIENATPSRLVMTFSLTLANTVPGPSAFTVMVNSVQRSVNTVAVSGTTVQLTLATPVIYGDVITVSYTKPASNMLQTPSGGQAPSMGPQRVTNNINPPLPVYISSVIQNATPSRLEMTYSIALGNNVPPTGSFAVIVNSASRAVNSVAVSGTAVILTLAAPVVNGDVVTVAYTKPASNQLQTSAGAQAATLSPQPVRNNVEVVNLAPVIVVNKDPVSYGGFVSELSASESYDPDKDNLTFKWTIPDGIPVSATSSSEIDFLSPVVKEVKNVEFILTVSDSKKSETKSVPVQILPFEPGLDTAEVKKVEVSSFADANYPSNILDNNTSTMWASNGDNEWIILQLKESFSVRHIKLAFNNNLKCESYFDIYGSQDNLTWDPILIKSQSCAFSGNYQVFSFPATKAEKEFRYIKFIGHGNSTDKWNYVSEFKLLGIQHNSRSRSEDILVNIYPNPAVSSFHVKIDGSLSRYNFIRIVNFSGEILYQLKVDPSETDFQLPVDLLTGVYLVQIGYNDLTLFSQKLVISK